MATIHTASTRNLNKDLKARGEKAQKVAAELQIGENYIKDKLKMASETLMVSGAWHSINLS